jgi:hypothetical protein
MKWINNAGGDKLQNEFVNLLNPVSINQNGYSALI